MKIFRQKTSDIFHISVQSIDFGYSLEPPRRGGSNEYPQSMFLSKNKKNNVCPCKPQFYYIKVGFKGVKLYRHVFLMAAGLHINMEEICFSLHTFLEYFQSKVFKTVLELFIRTSDVIVSS